MKKCYCCGAEVPDQSKFCPKCGKPMEITQDLIDRAKAGDSDAQTELYERTYKTVYSRIRAKVPDEDTVMDIMQESYLSAFTNLDQLQKAATFPSWLLTIASRQVCAWYRKNGKESENVQMSQLEYENDDTVSEEDDLLDQPEYREDFSPDESLDRAETGRLLSEILDSLPEDQRIILTMRYYDEMSLKEISEELGVNLSTVKTRLTAGKKKVEAKVLELEKSGTKLYSLGPVAFLVFLLHHMELFAPEIPANTIIGLTAAGAGAGGAAATAAHVTAGAAAKTAVAAAAKGVSVKVIAIVAAAVVVVGGGVTAGVVVANNSNHQETAAVSETVEQATPVELTPEKTPAEDDEDEPEPFEQPDDAVVTEGDTDTPEETPEENTEQQEPEPSESEEDQEEEVPDLPSYDAVYDMTEPLSEWVSNVTFAGYYEDESGQSSSIGKIFLNTNRAVELACYVTPGYVDNEEGFNDYYIPEDDLNASLRKMFGSQYQLSDFTNTVIDYGYGEQYISDFKTEYPNYYFFYTVYRSEDGRFHEDIPGRDGGSFTDNIIVKSIEPNGNSGCTATVEYDNTSSGAGNPTYTTYSIDVQYDLIPDESAEYGWAITSFSFSDEYNVEDHVWEDYDYY